MKRDQYKSLLKWKNDNNRKPLLIQGARQVGKTYLVGQFGKNEYSNYIYLNFEQQSELTTLFLDTLDPHKILENIGLTIGKKIEPDNTLIFFDEIQIASKVLTSLKYFCEQASEYHIIAAGSLLGVSVGKSNSFPVGKVNFMTLYPMSFKEYLMAVGEDLLLGKIENMQKIVALPEILHNKLNNHLKKYLYIGGMPEVLQNYLDNQDIETVRNIQNDILKAYQRDFSKYTEKTQAIRTSELWNSIPLQLAKEKKKFKYSDVKKNARASNFEQTIEWLKQAGLINLVYNLKTPKLPMRGYADYAKFKVYLHDTGLLGAMLDLSSRLIVEPTKIYTEYNGAFIENFVAQQFVAGNRQELFYWTSKSDAEVDFVLQFEDEIYPFEVKSGLSRNLKSIRSYENKYSPKKIFRLSPRNFEENGSFVNIPLYASFVCGNFISQIMH